MSQLQVQTEIRKLWRSYIMDRFLCCRLISRSSSSAGTAASSLHNLNHLNHSKENNNLLIHSNPNPYHLKPSPSAVTLLLSDHNHHGLIAPDDPPQRIDNHTTVGFMSRDGFLSQPTAVTTITGNSIINNNNRTSVATSGSALSSIRSVGSNNNTSPAVTSLQGSNSFRMSGQHDDDPEGHNHHEREPLQNGIHETTA